MMSARNTAARYAALFLQTSSYYAGLIRPEPTAFERPARRLHHTSTSTLLHHLNHMLSLLWAFTESDFLTFAIPNTLFGLCSAVALALPPLLTTTATATASIGGATTTTTTTLLLVSLLYRLPAALAFNVLNLLLFDLANQRTPRSIAEDRLNKPWRPIPSGRVSAVQARRALLALVPPVLALDVWVWGVPFQVGAGIMLLTWMYNDLGGGDEAFVREVLISLGYGLFNLGSLEVMLGGGASSAGDGMNTMVRSSTTTSTSVSGFVWTVMVSGVILTTMQVQDLKDREGDRARRRRTIVLFCGEEASRCFIAGAVCLWTVACARFWQLGPLVYGMFAMIAAVVVGRVLFVRWSYREDARTWRWWCFWHSSLYVMPLCSLATQYLA